MAAPASIKDVLTVAEMNLHSVTPAEVPGMDAGPVKNNSRKSRVSAATVKNVIRFLPGLDSICLPRKKKSKSMADAANINAVYKPRFILLPNHVNRQMPATTA